MKQFSSHQPPFVLVADANEDNLFLLTTLVEDLGFRSLALASGTAAIQAGKRYCPDLVLTETRFPNIHGSEVLASIRRYHSRARVVGIAVTSAAMPGDRDHCLGMGFDDYLAKPYSILKLEQLIYKHICYHTKYSDFSRTLAKSFPNIAKRH